MAESEEELNRSLMSVKEESGKAGLKLGIQKTKIMAPGSNISWKIKIGKTRSSFLELKNGFKRCLLLGRKTVTNLDSVLKSRDITLLTKVYIVHATVFPVVMYRCETVKKAERQRTDAF